MKPKLKEARKIRHSFTKETLKKLQIRGGDFLNEAKKKKFYFLNMVKLLPLHLMK